VNELTLPLQHDLAGVITRLERRRSDAGARLPDVRVILGMSDDPRAEIREGHFDRDLHQLVAERELRVPPLRERPEDIPAIAAHFVAEHARQLGRSVEGISARSLRNLTAYPWPGNVRELRHVLERAVILAEGSLLEIQEESLGEGVSLGSYRLVRQIGSGGMGEVWLARHSLLARPAAVKLIRSIGGDGRSETALRARFRREAEVTARLHSLHTVQLYDFGVSDTGTFYYVMELLRGMDLARMVRRFGPVAPERTVHLLRQACSSLVEAHERGLVHRDIKPANLFVTALGSDFDVLKVLDFGVVKATLAETTPHLTQPGRAQGTPAFMAPELALGEPDLDGRADLYSLGCVAFWMLTGMLVFEGDNAARMIMDHVQTPPRAPSSCSELEVPPALDEIVLRCLAKEPGERFRSAADLRDALGAVSPRSPWTESRAREWWLAHGSELLAEPDTPVS
jgi:serine/threonine protein kinase